MIVLFLIVGGILLWENSKISSLKDKVSSNNQPNKEQRKPISPPSDQPENPLENLPPSNNNKIEIKVFWNGTPELFMDGYEDCWVFISEINPKDRFLISQKLPVLVNKNLEGSGFFTLAYSENEVAKKVIKISQSGNQLTLLESNFTLTPDSPLTDEPDFHSNWGKRETKKKVKFVGWSSNNEDSPSQDLTFNNYLSDEPKPDKIEVFYISRDCELAKQLIRENKLQVGKKFILSFTKVAEYDRTLNAWFFDPTCDRKIWISEV